MRIKGVHLDAFGGMKDSSVEFSEGLNVCLGENEAGKSTHMDAIFTVLFFPSNIRRSASDFKDYIAPYFPVIEDDRGDTITARLVFQCREGHGYELLKSWGTQKQCIFTLPDGSQLTDEKKVHRRLQDILGYGKATYESIMFARQADILQTIEKLRQNGEATADVGHILRSMVFESGGVSVDDLKGELYSELNQLLKYWDDQMDRPQNNRGIDNPYKNPGELLGAYYRVENLKGDIRRGLEAEKALDQVNGELADITSRMKTLKSEIDALEQLEADIRQREKVSLRLEGVKQQYQDIKEIIKTWPLTEQDLKTKQKEWEEHQGKIAELQEAETQAQRYEASAKKLELYQKVRPLKQEIDQHEKTYAKYPNISNQDITALRKLAADIEQVKTKIEAVRLTGQFSTDTPLTVKVTQGAAEAQRVQVDRRMDLEGKGRIKLSTDHWTLEIKSGEEDIDALLNRLENLQNEYQNQLERLSIQDLAQGEQLAQERSELGNKITRLKDQVTALLSGQKFEDLEAEISELKNLQPPAKSAADISREINELKIAKGKLESQMESLQEKITRWEEKYGDFDGLTDRHADLRSEEKQLTETLAQLASLPEGYSSGEAFLAHLKSQRETYAELNDRLSELKQEKVQLQHNLPETSVEELQVELEKAQQDFDRLYARAKSLKMIEEELEQLAREEAIDNFELLEESFSTYLPLVTNNRYVSGRFQGPLPDRIEGEQGKSLPVDCLSQGTKSGVSLAIRLAMARFLLADMPGFVIMDDPLVDLDPARKEGAAQLIQTFAKEKQVIITTCDPRTAELLGGSVIAFD